MAFTNFGSIPHATLLSFAAAGSKVAPNWMLGTVCGADGLAGGYLGARLRPAYRKQSCGLLLGSCAVVLALFYLLQAVRGIQ